MLVRAARSAGFTIIEVMIALLILLIGISGILALQMTSMRATSFSRHATEASVVGEEKMEELISTSVAQLPLVQQSDLVDSRGKADPDCDPACNYTRSWVASQIEPGSTVYNVVVTVTWLERGSEPYTITLASQREL